VITHSGPRANENAQSSRAISIAVVSMCYVDPNGPGNTAYTTGFCDIARKNMRNYCGLHGYRLIFHDRALNGTDDRPAVWAKIHAIQQGLASDGITHVFWMDADSLFMHSKTSLDFLLPSQGKYLTMSGDRNCMLNFGHMMFSKDKWTETFLTKVGDAYPCTPWAEQSAMVYVLTGANPECRNDCRPCCKVPAAREADVREQSQMNDYLDMYKPGHFILHFAGNGHVEKTNLMQEYAKQVDFATATDNSDKLLAFHGSVLAAVRAVEKRPPTGTHKVTISKHLQSWFPGEHP